MKYLSILFCLLGIAFAVRDKQLDLEDIEKDNLASERRVHQIPKFQQQQIAHQYITRGQELQLQVPQVPQQYVAAPPREPPTPPKFQYGFKPMKDAPQAPQQYSVAPQRQQHLNLAAIQQQQQQFVIPQYYAYQPVHEQAQQQLGPSKAQQYVQANPQYQQVQYVTDNNILAQDTNALQQYYTPQYLLFQQTPAASNNIQAVIDPKGGIQYVMYVPASYLQGAKAEQTQTVETLAPQPQAELYATPGYTVAQAVPEGGEQLQYIIPQAQTHVPAPEAPVQKFQDIQYVQQAPVQQRAPKIEYVPQKYEPKSLLDSYVPSILQVQYYKQQQQQAHANAIRHSLKSASQSLTGKGDFVKNYVPQAAASTSHQSFNFQYAYPRQNIKH